MTRYVRHAPGALVTFLIVAIFVAGMMFEHAHQFGIPNASGSTTPTTALAADHSTTSTTAGK